LISLEEARAQRSRSATVYPAAMYNSSADSAPSVPFPLPTQEMAMISSNNSPSGLPASRARGRSVSAGAKARNALQSLVGGPSPDRRGSESSSVEQQPFNGGMPGKLLKHKKSGFMRLFNGKEQKEKEKAPPPVPPLSDSYFSNQPPVSKTLKVTTHRIPVPRLSPSLLEDSSTAYATSPPDNSSSENHDYSTGSHKLAPSPKRPFPPLSINTSSPGQGSRAPASATAVDHTFQKSWMAPPSISGMDNGRAPPQSAPPDVSDFPALKLRPVSTMFSAHFRDHIVRQDSPQFDRDLDTLSSMSPTATSPLTPGYILRPDGSSDGKTAVTPEDQSSVIQALQDQIISAKRAWQQNIWDLEGQVRDLKAEVEDLRAAGNDKVACEVCARGKQSQLKESGNQQRGSTDERNNVVNRPRARTGISARFGSGN